MKLLLAFIFVFMLTHKSYCQNKLIYGFDLNAGVSNFVLNKSSTLYTDKAKNWANANISYDPQLAYGINLVAEYQLNKLLSNTTIAEGGVLPNISGPVHHGKQSSGESSQAV